MLRIHHVAQSFSFGTIALNFKSSPTGWIFAISANVIWGLFPIFWNLLQSVPTNQLVCHRVVWAFGFSLLIFASRYALASPRRRARWIVLFRRPRTWLVYGAAALMVFLNWGAFLWAMNHDQYLAASLGYYINPMCNVLLGVLFLGERLSSRRKIAMVGVGIGVAVMTYAAGQPPWVSLIMATSFSLYALIKKVGKLDGLNSLFLETTILLLPVLLFMAAYIPSSEHVFAAGSRCMDLLLIAGGFVTLAPLVLFSAAAQRIPLSLLGMLQYVGPTMQFLVAVFYMQQPLHLLTAVGFVFVWAGVVLFLIARD
ncbi:EamA-like transporter family protein [Stieleria bergensis]|uniref:EamA-like transporter family protein n=1 Tax=Stieleria bergensis TaxID=2528025 RepID=A0A517SR47_9BACT|nr:EamA-like transporter family protein [Planctomycetes bacterium SV_7m_r]